MFLNDSRISNNIQEQKHHSRQNSNVTTMAQSARRNSRPQQSMTSAEVGGALH